MSRPARFARVLALALAVVTVSLGIGPTRRAFAGEPARDLLTVPTDASLAADAALVVDDVPEPLVGTIDLAVVAADARAKADALSASDWDYEALADALDYDSALAFAFVRDRIAFDPYPGVLRGADGTLSARAGNSFDRAVLLKTLLDVMLVPTRFAVGELDPATAEAVYARSFIGPDEPLAAADGSTDAPLDFGAISTRAKRDYGRLRAALGDRIDAIGDADVEAARAALGHHAWVQAFLGTEWVDLDPTMPDAQPGQPMTTSTVTVDALPVTDVDTITVSVVADVLSDGALSTMTALSVTLPAAQAAAGELLLYFQPELSGVGGSIVEALGGAAGFVPLLMVDGESTVGQALPVRGGTDIFSGEEEDGPQLAGVRLVVSRWVPGRSSVEAVRVLLDRVIDGSGSEVVLEPLVEDEAGPLALQQVHHVMVSTGGVSPWRYALRRAHAVDFVNSLIGEPDAGVGIGFDDLFWPVVVANEALVVASERSIIPALSQTDGVRAFVAEPRIFLVSVGASSDVDTVPAAVTDLLVDPVSVIAQDAQPGAAARAELWYGTLQAALETEFLISLARSDTDGGAVVRSISVATKDPLTVLTPDDATGLANAPPTLIGALDQGLLAVVPGALASTIGWWTVNPSDGTTRSVSRSGLGWGDYSRRGGYPPSRPNNGPRYDISPNKARPKGVPAGTCRAAGEYMTPIGCVSLPGAIAFWGVSAAVALIVTYGITLLWQAAIGY